MMNGGTPPQYSNRQAPPPPSPPRWRKEDIFRDESFVHVDQHVLKTPTKLLLGTFRELVVYLTSNPDWDDLEKVRAIFRWVTSVDVFSLEENGEAPKQSPMDYFFKIRNNLGNHAHLFSGLCQMAGIHCEIISGMNKSAAYEIGQKTDRKAMGAQWNAVYVQNSWQFIDAFWASACLVGKRTGEWTLVDSDSTVDEEEEGEVTEGTTQHRVNEFYFLPSPEELIWTHYPDKREWQLLHSPVTLQQFQDHFYVRERFHLLHMSLTPHSKLPCVLKTKDGEVDIEFFLPPENSSKLRFKYMLYRSRMRSDTSQEVVLDRFVLFEHREDLLRFSLRFPVKGTFKMDIYGLDVSDSDIFDLCCTYVIECPHAKANCMPLPDCPPLGWGPVNKTKEAGLTPVTHKQAQVVSKDGYVEIRLDKERALALHQQLKHSVLDDATLSKYCLTRQEDGEVIISLRLPQKGEYALKMFAQEPGAVGDAENVLNYLIQCQGLTEGSRPFPNTTHGTLGKGPDADRFKVTPLSHPGGTLDTKDGKVSVSFAASPNTELICEVHTVDGKASRQVKATRSQDNGQWVFDLDLPTSGEYSLNIFAKEKGNDAEIFSVHSYLVQSDGRPDSVQTDPADGGDESDDINEVQVETVETSDKEIFIPLPPGCEHAMVEFHRRNGQNAPCNDQVEVITVDDVTMFKVRMEDYGEYMLNVYTEQSPGRVRNAAKYQVNRRRPGELYSNNINTIMDNLEINDNNIDMSTPTPDTSGGDDEQRRVLARRQVQQAMDLKDQKQLEAAIARYKDTGVNDSDPVLVKAGKMLQVLKAKAELMDATQKRDFGALEKALKNARAVNFDHHLDLQIAVASRLHEHLARLEKLRHSVLDMDQKTVAELKTYGSPPEGVHQSMMATFLLLGSPLKDVKVWRTCQALMSKTGKESMMRKISKFDPRVVPLSSAAASRKILAPFSKEQIRDASAGAATFFIWAQGMIEEVESYGGAEQADQMRLQK
ncbi:uncharacterized protein LOC112573518 isoform X2 [Pomacea canaliculata]|uniref:uncharacterized protein LOC112573518 isoform X2 n=1 Tax=Pomacea canaliculata TaxID=400727 RepID=UPI000D72CB61|nr:uncharacterized protein LOC112573518 isoform X2 [Pomacea canaliculata]